MRQTIIEKIFSEHSGKRVKSGDAVIASVDLAFGQDSTSSYIIDGFKNLGTEDVLDKSRFCMVMDHASPSPSIAVAADHDRMRAFARAQGVQLFDIGSGICHQVIPETGHITCGDLIVGADSHTSTCGALNAAAIGVGAIDLAMTIAGGKNWFRVPETIKVVIDGDLQKGVYAKDIMLRVIKQIGVLGASYRSLEFCGEAIDSLSVEGRFAVASMAGETGAKCAIMKADRKTLDWARKHCPREPKPVEPDEDARYAEVRKFDISDLSPQVACPHSAANVSSVDDVKGKRVDVVVIGTCTNGRLEDMEIAAKILKGNKVARGLKLIITPASKKIYLEMVKKGLVEIFVDSGAIVNNPGCGPCAGTHQGVLGDGEVAFSTSSRNIKGRMGNPNSEIYLGSPATAAATAIAGKISDPRDYKRKL